MSSTDVAPSLLVASHGAVRVLTLNRPAALNSFTAEMHGLLRAALDDAAADAGVRALVITGSGRGFCAGQDLNDPAMAGPDADVGDIVERMYKPLALRIRAMPVIADWRECRLGDGEPQKRLPSWRCSWSRMPQVM